MENELTKKINQATKWSTVTEISSKLVTPITNLILARLLAPEAFGVVATLTMVISFAEIFTDAGFQKYLIQREFQDEAELELCTNVAFWTNIFLSLAAWGVIAVFAKPIAALVGSEYCDQCGNSTLGSFQHSRSTFLLGIIYGLALCHRLYRMHVQHPRWAAAAGGASDCK